MFRNTRRCLSQDMAQPRPRGQDSRQNGLQTANFSLDSFDLVDLTKIQESIHLTSPKCHFKMSTDSARQPFLEYTDDPEKEEARRYVRVQTRKGNILPYLFVAIITSLLWSVVILFFVDIPRAGNTTEEHEPSSRPTGRYNITTNAHRLSCGNSVSEAKALNCKYDLLLNNWVPEPCFDKEWLDEYKEDDSWGGYADEEMTRKLSVEEMSEADHYWTSLRDHVNHCAMMWRKQFWALYEERKAFDTVIASPGHTDHCSQFLIDVTDNSRNWTHPTKTSMGFAGCWVRDDR